MRRRSDQRSARRGNIAVLREIAEGPDGFTARQGWGVLDTPRDNQVEDLGKLCVARNRDRHPLRCGSELRESHDYEFMTMCRVKPEVLVRFAEERTRLFEAEIAELPRPAPTPGSPN
jgi:hypothetical protein